MKVKIVLVDVSPEKTSITMDAVPPLGLGYIAAYLESVGHNVSLIEGVKYEYSLSKALDLIISEKPAIVGFNATSFARLRAVELINNVKKHTGALTVAGGPHFHATARQALCNIPGLDVVVKGEGELTLSELSSAYESNKSFEQIKGIFFRSDGKIIETADRPIVMDLDSLPIPAYHLFSLNKYKGTLKGTNMKAIGVISSRGCPNKCKFCANRVLRKQTLRLRDPKKFVDEVELLHNTYGYEAFDFWDDTMTMVKEHIFGICEEIKARNLKIKWFARARVNTVDKQVLQSMKDAGCVAIAYGVESGSEAVLRQIDKGITIAQVKEAIKASTDIGFNVSNYFIVSLPGETMSDIDATIKLMRELAEYKNVHNYYCFAMIYPGTELEQIAKDKGLFPKDFNWYQPFDCQRNLVVGNNPIIPCYENPELPFELIKSYIISSKSLIEKLKAAIKRLAKIKNVFELTGLLKTAFASGTVQKK